MRHITALKENKAHTYMRPFFHLRPSAAHGCSSRISTLLSTENAYAPDTDVPRMATTAQVMADRFVGVEMKDKLLLALRGDIRD